MSSPVERRALSSVGPRVRGEQSRDLTRGACRRGRERTVNWTQNGNTVRVSGVNDFWTLRLGEEALCIYRDTSAIYVSD